MLRKGTLQGQDQSPKNRTSMNVLLDVLKSKGGGQTDALLVE